MEFSFEVDEDDASRFGGAEDAASVVTREGAV
jgi:hypothetical protein